MRPSLPPLCFSGLFFSLPRWMLTEFIRFFFRIWRIYLVYVRRRRQRKRTRLRFLSPSLFLSLSLPLSLFLSPSVFWMWSSMRPGESLEGSSSAHGRCIDANNITNSGTERCLTHLSSATRRMKRVTTKRRMRGTNERMRDGGMTAMRCFLWSLVLCSLSSRAQGKGMRHPQTHRHTRAYTDS